MMRRAIVSAGILIGAVGALAWASAGRAGVAPFPTGFRLTEIETDGATIHVRVGGAGPVVVMLHGFGDTGDMWAPVAGALAGGHAVIVPDLRGMGLSSHPEGGYDKAPQARDVARVMDALGRQSGAGERTR